MMRITAGKMVSHGELALTLNLKKLIAMAERGLEQADR